MAKVLVFGGRGWVGQALVSVLTRAGHEVAAPRSEVCDVADARDVDRVFAHTQPAAVVNAAAINPGAGDEARMRAVNAEAARHVAVASARCGARLVHVSTDVVLDGRSAPYRDDAKAAPLNAYGRTKADGEAAVLAACPSAVAVRTSLVYDPAAPDASTRGFIEKLRTGEPCRLFTDEIRCPIARPALAAALTELIALDVAGTLNVAGAEALSRHEFGRLLLDWFKVPKRRNVEAARAADLAEPRPLDLTLDVSKARSLLAAPLLGVRETLSADEGWGIRGGKVARLARRPNRGAPRSR